MIKEKKEAQAQFQRQLDLEEQERLAANQNTSSQLPSQPQPGLPQPNAMSSQSHLGLQQSNATSSQSHLGLQQSNAMSSQSHQGPQQLNADLTQWPGGARPKHPIMPIPNLDVGQRRLQDGPANQPAAKMPSKQTKEVAENMDIYRQEKLAERKQQEEATALGRDVVALIRVR